MGGGRRGSGGVAGAQAVEIEWVTVGDPGNAVGAVRLAPPSAGSGPGRYCGRVRYAYAIGKYEVDGRSVRGVPQRSSQQRIPMGLYNQEMDVDSGLPDAEYGLLISSERACLVATATR